MPIPQDPLLEYPQRVRHHPVAVVELDPGGTAVLPDAHHRAEAQRRPPVRLQCGNAPFERGHVESHASTSASYVS